MPPPLDWTVQDGEVIATLSALVGDRPSRGFWKCYKLLRRMGKCWNHKCVYRVYKAMKLNPRFSRSFLDVLTDGGRGEVGRLWNQALQLHTIRTNGKEAT